MIGLSGLFVVGDRVQVLALAVWHTTGVCWFNACATLVRAPFKLGLGGRLAACALVELTPLLCHCLGCFLFYHPKGSSSARVIL
jgi:hypothetical protein